MLGHEISGVVNVGLRMKWVKMDLIRSNEVDVKREQGTKYEPLQLDKIIEHYDNIALRGLNGVWLNVCV